MKKVDFSRALELHNTSCTCKKVFHVMTINQEEKLERVVFEKVLYMAQEEEKMKYDGLQEFPYTY